jgi:ATP-dependent protease HslVU (ClpYQ) peptidase subunit
MTCIVGYIENEIGYMGADSAGTGGYSQTIRKDPKVFKVDKRFLIGCCGSYRMTQLLMSSKFNPPKQKSDQTDYDYMITDFIDSVIELFKDNGFLSKENEEISGGKFLVIYKNKLYQIEADFQVGESYSPFDCVGCGDDLALGAMYVLQNYNLTPMEKVKHALLASETFSSGVRQPFLILTTKDESGNDK